MAACSAKAKTSEMATTEANGLEPAIERTTSSTVDKHYDYPTWRKYLIVFATSWMTLSATASSTSLFTAASEIAETFGTTPTKVNLSTAGLLLAMAFSSFLWGPINLILGRKIAYNTCIVVLFAFTLGAALAPDMPTFVAMRILAGLEGTAFHVMGQIILAEYFQPTQRGTATGFFLFGSVLGPPSGPCIAGIIVTYNNWRVIIWFQAAMIGVGLILSIVLIPYPTSRNEKRATSFFCKHHISRFNPMRVFKIMSYPDILFTDLTCGLLSWTQYSLLAAPRQILDTVFHLQSPLTAGLFYLAPTAGFLVGTIAGGWFSDKTVKKWIAKRNGVRLPQDRLRSGMMSFFVIIPVFSLIYGWCLDQKLGGLTLALVSVFFVSAGLLIAFASLNTYCSETQPGSRVEVITGKYCIQYIFGAVSSATITPLFERIGIGPSVTIGVSFVLVGGGLTLLTAMYGRVMHEWWGRPSKS